MADGKETLSERAGKQRFDLNLDRRTKAAQVAVSTKAAIMSDLGGEDRLSTLERLQCENAAMGRRHTEGHAGQVAARRGRSR